MVSLGNEKIKRERGKKEKEKTRKPINLEEEEETSGFLKRNCWMIETQLLPLTNAIAVLSMRVPEGEGINTRGRGVSSRGKKIEEATPCLHSRRRVPRDARVVGSGFLYRGEGEEIFRCDKFAWRFEGEGEGGSCESS